VIRIPWILDDTVLRLLAERRAAYVELEIGDSGLAAYATELEGRRGKFVRFSISERRSANCMAWRKERGLAYRLHMWGMQADECLAAETIVHPTGRFNLKTRGSREWGANFTHFDLVDTENVIPVSSIVSAFSGSKGSYGGLLSSFSPRAKESCRADIDSVVSAFAQAMQVSNLQTVPHEQRVEMNEASTVITLRPASLDSKEFGKLFGAGESDSAIAGALRLATAKGRAIVMKDGKFVSHLEAYSGQIRGRILAARSHIIIVLPTAQIVVLSPELEVKGFFTATAGDGAPVRFFNGTEAIVHAERLYVSGRRTGEPYQYRLFEIDLSALGDKR